MKYVDAIKEVAAVHGLKWKPLEMLERYLIEYEKIAHNFTDFESWLENEASLEIEQTEKDAEAEEVFKESVLNEFVMAKIKAQLEKDGEAAYRGRLIYPHPGSGYTATGFGRYETVEDVIWAIDQEEI